MHWTLTNSVISLSCYFRVFVWECIIYVFCSMAAIHVNEWLRYLPLHSRSHSWTHLYFSGEQDDRRRQQTENKTEGNQSGWITQESICCYRILTHFFSILFAIFPCSINVVIRFGFLCYCCCCYFLYVASTLVLCPSFRFVQPKISRNLERFAQKFSHSDNLCSLFCIK